MHEAHSEMHWLRMAMKDRFMRVICRERARRETINQIRRVRLMAGRRFCKAAIPVRVRGAA